MYTLPTGNAMQFFNFHIRLRLSLLRTAIFTIIEHHLLPVHPLHTLSSRVGARESQKSIGLRYFTLILQYIYDDRLSQPDHPSHLIITPSKNQELTKSAIPVPNIIKHSKPW